MVIVTMRHCRQAKACALGVLKFLKRHKLDYRKFFREGLPAEDFEGTGDAMAIRIAALARREAGEARVVTHEEAERWVDVIDERREWREPTVEEARGPARTLRADCNDVSAQKHSDGRLNG